jgi:hypothetical protein
MEEADLAVADVMVGVMECLAVADVMVVVMECLAVETLQVRD